jgi:hypothetical protein
LSSTLRKNEFEISVQPRFLVADADRKGTDRLPRVAAKMLNIYGAADVDPREFKFKMDLAKPGSLVDVGQWRHSRFVQNSLFLSLSLFLFLSHSLAKHFHI